MIRSVIIAGGKRKIMAMNAQLNERAVEEDSGAFDTKPDEEGDESDGCKK